MKHRMSNQLLSLSPSGIRRFTALARQVEGCVSLTIGEPRHELRSRLLLPDTWADGQRVKPGQHIFGRGCGRDIIRVRRNFPRHSRGQAALRLIADVSAGEQRRQPGAGGNAGSGAEQCGPGHSFCSGNHAQPAIASLMRIGGAGGERKLIYPFERQFPAVHPDFGDMEPAGFLPAGEKQMAGLGILECNCCIRGDGQRVS